MFCTNSGQLISIDLARDWRREAVYVPFTMRFSEEHEHLRRTVREFVEKEINPHVDAWERDGAFPAHEVFKKAGRLGLLGVNKREAYGGMGLDYSYQMVVTEELGTCHGGSIPMAIGVQTDMATPALARWGADELRREFLAPAIAGEVVASIAVSEASGGSDVHSAPLRRREGFPCAERNPTGLFLGEGSLNLSLDGRSTATNDTLDSSSPETKWTFRPWMLPPSFEDSRQNATSASSILAAIH